MTPGLRTHLAAAAALLALGATSTGCVSETAIYTRPAGAEVVLLERGRVLGKTPILLRDQVWVFTEHELEFTKPGYLPTRITLEPTARPLNIVFCAICSVATWPVWPMALLGDFTRSKYVITLEPTGDGLAEAREPMTSDPKVTFAAAP
jgi:hypothetical protein